MVETFFKKSGPIIIGQFMDKVTEVKHIQCFPIAFLMEFPMHLLIIYFNLNVYSFSSFLIQGHFFFFLSVVSVVETLSYPPGIHSAPNVS